MEVGPSDLVWARPPRTDRAVRREVEALRDRSGRRRRIGQANRLLRDCGGDEHEQGDKSMAESRNFQGRVYRAAWWVPFM